MSVKDRMYHVLVNRIPGIQEKYKKKRSLINGAGKYLVWLYLFWLNISYYVFRNKKLAQSEKHPYYEEKILYSEDSESALSKRESPEKFASKLAQYDVISFDVFDTLVLRPFSSPTDLFYILGDKLKYLDFHRIRCVMEWRAREKKYKRDKHYEVNLDEIYSVLSEETGIDKNQAMIDEVELEYTYCFANPYMFRVVEELIKYKKKIIITSDMYLNTEQIKTLLRRCGYLEFDSYYVSCDMKKSKNKGDIYNEIKCIEGQKREYAHVGDNYSADIDQSQKHGFKAFYYTNVNMAGMPYRPDDMSVITGGIYRGLINAHIHNGLNKYSREYEFGHIYGGLFVVGYCQFIHEYVSSHDIDKVLFLARDGYVLMKAYTKMYPEEKHKVEYVYWSRLAATKLAAGHYKYDYFRRFLYHKVNQKYTLKDIFSTMELEILLPQLCVAKGLSPTLELTDFNVDTVKNYLLSNWKQVLDCYEEQVQAGKEYYQEVLKECKKSVTVDIGWAGSGAMTLDYLVNNVWKLNCDIVGIVAGTNSCHNSEADTSETFLQTGKLISYMYSQRENRDIWKLHDPSKGHNLLWEALLDAPMGSFIGFYLDDNNKYICKLKKENNNVERIKEIQKGILDFVSNYKTIYNYTGKIASVSGRDAYAPMINTESKLNKKFTKSIIDLLDSANVE